MVAVNCHLKRRGGLGGEEAEKVEEREHTHPYAEIHENTLIISYDLKLKLLDYSNRK